MKNNIISILTGLLLGMLSINSLAATNSCPSPNYIRGEANNWMYAHKWSDGRWIFLSDIFYYNNDAWDVALVLDLPNINDSRAAMTEASKQIKTLNLIDPYPGSYDSCNYTPQGVGYSVEAHSPPLGP